MHKILRAFSIGLFLYCSFSAVAQNKKVETKFFRPSMTTTFMASQTNQTAKIISYFKQLPMEARFDERKVSNNQLSVSDKKNLMVGLAPVTREVVGSLFGRDISGNMTYDKLMEAAKYAATDNQALSSGASKDVTKVYFQIADELLKRCYILSYDITKVQTYQEYYDEQDQRGRQMAQKSGKPFVPAVRTKEGWIVNYAYYIHRINWNDTIQNYFFEQLWLDESVQEERSTRKSAFETYSFPLELVYSSYGSATSSQSNDPNYYKGNLFAKRRSMDELLSLVPKMMQDRVIFVGGKKIDDFKMKAPIFQEYPTTVKLGKKEGLYYDQRFFVYDIIVDKDGNQHKKRRGVVRPKAIADNVKIADGDSPASSFQQQGGRYLYQGSLVELKEDVGIGLSAGYGLVDQIYGGVTLGLDFRIPRFTKNILPLGANKLIRNLHLNAGFSINSFTSKNIFEPTSTYFDSLSNIYSAGQMDTLKTKYNSYLFTGSSSMFYVSLSREIYFTRKGNVFVAPEIAYSMMSLIANEKDSQDSIKAKYTFSNSSLMGGLGIGYHLTPSIQLFVKAFVNYKLGFFSMKDQNGRNWTSDKDGTIKNGSIFDDPLNVSASSSLEKVTSSWGLNKMNDISTPLYVGVRFKF